MSWNKTKQTIDASKNCEALSKSQKNEIIQQRLKRRGEGAREKLAKQALTSKKQKKQINKTNTYKQTKTKTTQTAHRL